MTRRDAVDIIYHLIGSDILDPHEERVLSELADTLCDGEFEPCRDEDADEYCEDCPYFEPYVIRRNKS